MSHIDPRRVVSYTVPRLTPPFRELMHIMVHVRPELQVVGSQFYVARRVKTWFAWPRWDFMEIQVLGATGPAPGVHPFPYIRRAGFGMTRITAALALQRSEVIPAPARIDLDE